MSTTDPDIGSSFRPRILSPRAGLRVLSVLLVAQIVGGWLAVRPERWLVERIEFVGASRASVAELRHLVDIENGTTIWAVDLAAVEEGAANHPWVRRATARREWPDRVVIEVDEYRPVALLDRQGLHYVDRDGTVFLSARSDDLDHPILTGIDPKLAEHHPDLPRLAIRDALYIVGALDERGLVSRDRVSEVGFDADRGFTVSIRGGARVLFGLEHTERQIERLSKLLDEGVNLDLKIIVDLAPESLAIVRRVGELSANKSGNPQG